MRNFITVHEDGKEHLVNLDWIEEIIDDGEKATIYLGFQPQKAQVQDCIQTDEPYYAVKMRVMRGQIGEDERE